jgi:beta-galactosidase
MNAEVWLNQHLLARHPYGYTGFTVDLTPYLKLGKTNALRVIVDNASQLNSRWYSGSGIYRPVWLIVAEPVHIVQYGVYVATPEVSPQSAMVRVRTTVQNESGKAQTVTARSTVFAPDGVKVGEAATDVPVKSQRRAEAAHPITIAVPNLWSVERPNLYCLETEILVGGKVVDSASTPFGIRTLEFSAEKGFLLNGEAVKLKGGCVHHDNGVLGATSFPRSEERKVELLKASGFNAIRCAHNPPAPAMLDACDRLGMFVMDEAFDCWRIGKNPYDYHVAFDDWWQRDLDSMLLRDRNHPSVIIWSIGNEVIERDGRSDGVAIARMLADRVREVDPTRPVTSAICGVWDNNVTWHDTDGVFTLLDVGGYNYQWREYVNDHQCHPGRIMVGTESFPLEALDNWMAVEANPYVIGDFVWTSLDYLGESGIGRVHYGEKAFLGDYPWHQANCGDLDICGFKRPQSYYRDMVWQNSLPLYIAVQTPVPEGKVPIISQWGWPDVWPNWTWPGHDGQPFKVDVYSACEKVELFLNDRSLGIQPTTRAERLIATFEVAYEPGELKAIGYVGGKPVTEYALKTASTPTAIRLTADRDPIGSDDLCYVTVDVVDAQGIVHPTAADPIFFTVQGAGNLAAVGNGNPLSTERYRGNVRSTFHGRCLAVVKSNGKGEIKLRAQADGLDPAEVVIRASS